MTSPILKAKIALKWLQDKRHLPLDQALWKIYYHSHRDSYKELGRFPNLLSGKSFNDKIQWIKLFDQSELTIQCSDKLLVRDYVSDTIGNTYTPKLIRVFDSLDDFDLPNNLNKYVIKTNHDSGTVYLISNPSDVDRTEILLKLKASLSKTYGWKNGEWAYSFIKPKVFIEEFLESFPSKAAPPDYKFHCSNGKVCFLQYIYDRQTKAKEVILSPDGQLLKQRLYTDLEYSEDFIPPKQLNEMALLAEKLSKPFKYVRIDMYLINNRIYVGEMTFFPYKGCYKGEGQKNLGKLLSFDRDTYKKPFSGLYNSRAYL